MNKYRNLSSEDWQMLSAYLDNQLSDSDKRQVDQRLRSDQEYREALDSLQHASKLLHSLKVVRVPRNFTISPQSSPKRTIPSLIGVLRFSSAVAALLLVAAFALDLTQSVSPAAALSVAKDLQSQAAVIEPTKTPVGGPPMIIFWGGPAPAMGTFGKGGGGAEGSGLGIGGGPAQPNTMANIAPSVAETPPVEAAPLAQAPAPEKSANPHFMTVSPQVQSVPAPELEPLTGSGPVLGVQATESVGKPPPAVEVPRGQKALHEAIPFRLVEIVLAALLVVIAVPAWLLKRK